MITLFLLWYITYNSSTILTLAFCISILYIVTLTSIVDEISKLLFYRQRILYSSPCSFQAVTCWHVDNRSAEFRWIQSCVQSAVYTQILTMHIKCPTESFKTPFGYPSCRPWSGAMLAQWFVYLWCWPEINYGAAAAWLAVITETLIEGCHSDHVIGSASWKLVQVWIMVVYITSKDGIISVPWGGIKTFTLLSIWLICISMIPKSVLFWKSFQINRLHVKIEIILFRVT